MGLDQSIFTTSKAIAKAIYEGTTPNGKWSTAFFSPKNLEGKDDWTRFDTYAMSRRAQVGEEHTVSGPSEIGLFVITQGECDEGRRNATLDVIKSFNDEGVVVGDTPMYQIGLFRKFFFLDGILATIFKTEFCSDGMYGSNADLFKLLSEVSKRCLAMYANGTLNLDEYEADQLAELGDLADAILAFPEAEDADFAYNPWW